MSFSDLKFFSTLQFLLLKMLYNIHSFRIHHNLCYSYLQLALTHFTSFFFFPPAGPVPRVLCSLIIVTFLRTGVMTYFYNHLPIDCIFEFSLPNSYVETWSLVWWFRRQSLWEVRSYGWSSDEWDECPIKEIPESSLTPLTMWECSMNMAT